MLERAREETERDAAPPGPVVVQGRFARDASEFATREETRR